MIRAPLVLGGACAVLASLVPAQQQLRVDYPDSALTAPTLLFPFYTLGSGGTVRYQVLCPGGFASLPQQPMLVTRVGVQIAGRELYQRFEIRFGTTGLANLSTCWSTNLPDQRLQKDLSGTVLPGGVLGGAPVNQWVELELDVPFLWQPGQGIVLDLITSAATPGLWCQTAVGSHERLFSAPWSGGPCGVLDPSNGLKFRVVFEPLGFPSFGQGCAGSGGFAPRIAATGSSQRGSSALIGLDNALGGTLGACTLGVSRSRTPFAPLPFPLGGGCSLLTSGDLQIAVATSAVGPGAGTAALRVPIPASAALAGQVVFAQWLLLDTGSPAIVPLTTSNALSIVIY